MGAEFPGGAGFPARGRQRSRFSRPAAAVAPLESVVPLAPPSGPSRPLAIEDAAPAGPFADLTAEVEALELLSGADLSFSVGLPGGTFAHLQGDELLVSASAAKLYWVVAAVDAAGLAAVAPFAHDVFAHSDNEAAGMVIDLAGIDAINLFLSEKAGLQDTALVRWDYGRSRVASVYPGPLDGDNYTTLNDAVRFLTLLANGRLLSADETRAVLGWMAMSPRDSADDIEYAGILGNFLPASVQTGVMHKAGWLPPETSETGEGSLIDIGIVPVPGGSWYAIAVHGLAGQSFAALPDLLSSLSCGLYAGVTGDAAACAEDEGTAPYWNNAPTD